MTNRTHKKRRPSRLARIERKCDRILSELLILRRQRFVSDNIDTAIDRLHRAARNMRAECEREKDRTRKIYRR